MTPAPRFVRAQALVRDWTRWMTGGAGVFFSHAKGAKVAKALSFLFLVSCFGLAGCAGRNTTTTTYKATDPTTGASVVLELPKDIQATGVDITTAKGTRIKIKELNSTGNAEQTAAQGEREANRIKAASDLAGKVTEGAVQGAVKGVKGF